MSKCYLPCFAILLSIFTFSLSAQIDFKEHTIALGGQNFPGDSEVADFDGDGLLDILVYNNGGHRSTVTARQTNHIAWYKNLGNGEYQKHPISITHVSQAVPYDYDNDGDIDILCAYYYSGGDPRANEGGVRILLNDGTGKFSMNLIDSERSSEPYEEIDLIDINNDGFMDFIFGYEEQGWRLEQVGQDRYEAILTGRVSFSRIAFINRGNNDFRRLTIGGFSVTRDGGYVAPRSGDLNNDGYLDFGIMIYNNGTNTSTLGTAIFNPLDTNFIYGVVNNDILSPSAPSLYDYDDDGDLDLLQYFIPDGNGGGGADRVLFENDGMGIFTEVIISDFISVPTFYDYPELDFDGDGDLDQIIREYSWFENTGTDYIEHVIDSALIGNNTKIADLDQDGDWDIIVVIRDDDSEDYKRVYTWINDGNGNYSKHLLEDKNYWMRNFIATDLDGDGDNDLAVTSWINGDLFWYKNDGDQNFTEILIAEDQESILDIKLVDLDTDGDMDFVTTYSINGDLSWWENDGNGNFTKISIGTNSLNLYEVNIGDYDGDGDMDLVTGDIGNSRVFLWTNDGDNNFTRSQTLATKYPNPLESVDIDQDGDLDIIVGFIYSDEVALLENDGAGNFLTTTILEDVNASYLEIIDLDNDGNLDILVSDHNSNGKLTWLRNTGSDFVSVVLSDNPHNTQTASADYDDDGDIDIFYQKGFSTREVTTNDLRYLENDGNQNFTESVFDPKFFYGRDLQSFDLDQDGDLDLIGTSVALGFKWYENQLISDPNATTLTITSCPDDIRIVTADNFVKVDWDEPTATTSCADQNITFNQVLGAANGSDFPMGTQFIDYEITDNCGNKKGCSFRIIIEPEPDPAILTLEFCPQTITKLTNGTTATVVWNLPVATTTCDIPEVDITQVEGLPSGSDFPIGTHIITYEISDPCDNITTCSFNVIVDERSPVDCPKTLPGMTFLGEINGHHYFLSDATDNWRGAQATARSLGGYLVSINDSDERIFLRDNINEVVFIGINDAEEENTIEWDSGESPGSFYFTGINTEENDFGVFYFWNGTYGFDNQWVYKKFVIEIDCDLYQPCSMDAEISFVQCDDNGTLTDLQDDFFSFQMVVNGYGNTTYWTTNITGVEVTGDYNTPTDFDKIPIFAPGQTVTVTLDDADGGCSTTVDLDVPRPCPGTSLCPTELPGYEFLGRYNGHHYFISTNPSNWLEAFNSIKGINSYLVTINDLEENDFLKSRVNEIAFIGLTDYLVEGRAIWSTGNEPTYTNYGICGICSSNTEENDFSSFNFWDGTWGVDNQWVVRNHILEVECGIGTKIAPRTAKRYTPFTNHMNLFPNPVYQTATVDLELENDKMETFRIFNVQNQIVFEQKADLKKGMNRVKFDLGKLPSGFYFLKTTGDAPTLKFIVEGNK